MKIKQIDVFQADLKYSSDKYLLSGGRTYRSFDATVARLETEDGWVGWGESTPFGATWVAAHAAGVRAGIAEIAPALIGLDPRRVDRINDIMDQTLVGHPHVKTALDVACWDILGKSVNLPICELLGGRTESKLPLIASIYAGDPDDMRRRVAEYRKRGFIGHSVKIGDDVVLDAMRIESCLADRRRGEFYVVDANGGMTVESALRMLRLLPAGLDFVLEAPCATWRECMSLRRRTNIPMNWDELADSDASISQLVADDAAEGVSIKISKNGGLTKGRRQRDICLAAGLTLSVQDTIASDFAFAATVHLGQTVPEKFLRCVFDCRDMLESNISTADIPVVDGHVSAPTQPGLGAEPIPDRLKHVATFS